MINHIEVLKNKTSYRMTWDSHQFYVMWLMGSDYGKMQTFGGFDYTSGLKHLEEQKMEICFIFHLSLFQWIAFLTGLHFASSATDPCLALEGMI